MSCIRPIALGSLLLAAGAADAAEHPLKQFFPGTNTCYSRTYSAEHLQTHPQQRVRNIQIVHPFSAAEGLEGIDFRMALRFQLRSRKGWFGPISVYCNGDPDGKASCSVEADGGRFKLSKGAQESLVMTVERLQLEGTPNLEKGGDDRVLVLQKAPMKACPKNTS